MRAESENLLILQDRDQKIKALRNQHKSLPKDKKALEDKLLVARANLEQAKLLARENEVERRKLEMEVQGKLTSIGRFKTQQQQTRKNEEFQAFNHEIAHFEAEIRGLEDREMVLMEQAEVLQAKAGEAEKAFVKFEASIRDQIANLESGAAAAIARLGDLEAGRVGLAAKVSEETLTLYERLFLKKGDAAIVPLEHEVCGGCHMKVPTQTAVNVRTEQATVQCPNCGRILHRVI